LIHHDLRNATRLATHRLRRLARAKRGGGVVALVGPDGAGKSTVLAAVLARGAGIRGPRIESVYLGPWGQLETRFVRLIRRLGITPSREPWGRRVAAMDAQLPRAILKWTLSEAKAMIFYPAILAELWWRYLHSVAPRTRRGAWIVADRYITDLRYLYKGDLMPNYRLLRAAVCSLYPSPKLFVLVDQTPETIHERKPGLSVDQIRAFQEAYRRSLRGKRWMRITTDGTPEEAADRVLDATVRLWAGERAPLDGRTRV
jgi:thymidylate kinase